jgi:uncharacterized protein involved in exopolysaccharide biosynthesis
VNSVDDSYDNQGQTVDLIAIWNFLWRYKFVIIGSTLLFTGIALYKALTAISIYKAEVAIAEVSDEKMNSAAALASQIGGLASLVGVNLSGSASNARESQALLKSRHLAEKFVIAQNMMAVMYPPPAKPPSLWIGVRNFRDNILSIRDDKKLGLTTVSISLPDAKEAARLAAEFVRAANFESRDRAIADSKASIAYLTGQIQQTNVVELQKVLYNLVEKQTQTLMLANARPEYAFTTVDPAVPPEERASPRRTLIVAMGIAVGGLLGLAIAFGLNLYRHFRSAGKPA